MAAPAVSRDQLNRYLWDRQGFHRPAGASTLEVVAQNNGIYATSRTAYLSLLARVDGFQFADLDAELYEKRRMARMCGMRTSVFLIAEEMIPAVYQATQDRCLPGRQQFLPLAGISEADYRRIAGQVLGALEDRRLTVSEIKKALPDLSAHEQEGLKYIVAMMRAEASIARAGVRGTWKSDLFEYAPYHEWLPDIDLESIGPDEAKIAVARRYFEAYGPATADDLRWWSGFPGESADRALDALADELTPVVVEGLDGLDYLCLTSQVDDLLSERDDNRDAVRLLPVWDGYLMGYRDRDRYIPADWYEWVFDPSGNGASTVVDQGGVVGVWEMVEEKKTLMVKAFLFEDGSRARWNAIKAECARLAEAMGLREAIVQQCPAPPPLKEGGQNQFKSPLRDVEGDSI